MIEPFTENIVVYKNVDFCQCVDFYQDQEEMDLTEYEFRIKFLDNTGTELLSETGVIDLEKGHRVWFSLTQAELSTLPDIGATWYLLYKNPNSCIGLICYGKVKTKGGALWGV